MNAPDKVPFPSNTRESDDRLSLAQLFFGMVICASLLTITTSVIRVKPIQVDAMVVGLIFGVVVGLVMGLCHYRRWFGGAIGVCVGALLGPLILMMVANTNLGGGSILATSVISSLLMLVLASRL